MNREFIKVDLHVHTPASKCYRGPKSDEEYINILKKAKEVGIEMLAITDHNTIAGYEKILVLEKQIETKYNILKEFKDASIATKEAVEECEKKLKLFNEITIIPGVEITLNPGVHIIVLAEPNEYRELSNILDEIGYAEDKRGIDSGNTIDVDIKNFLKSSKLDNKIIIAPHVDSDKGIYKELSGQYRMEILKSNMISAITCNNVKQKEQLQELFSNDPNYKRSTQVAFINSSDAHGVEDIGGKLSFISLEQKNLKNLKAAFLDCENRVSDYNDNSISKRVLKILASEPTYTIDKIEELEISAFTKHLCACLNSKFTYILLGITKSGTLRGIKKDNEFIDNLLKESMDNIASKFSKLRYIRDVEKLGNGGIVVVIALYQDVNNLWYLKETEEVYVLGENYFCKKACIAEIEQLIQENTLLELGRLERKNNVCIDEIGLQLSSLRNMITKFDIMQKIELYSTPLLAFSEVMHYDGLKCDDKLEEAYFGGNGNETGNVYFAVKNNIRLQNAVLRYSCPMTTVPEDIIEDYDILEREALIITPMGGTYFAESQKHIIGRDTDFLVICPEKESIEEYSVLALLAWLKSSLFIWYTLKKRDSTNLYAPDILKTILVPYLECLKPNGNIENTAKQIIELENIFLQETRKENICNKCEKCELSEECAIEKRIDEHNRQVQSLAEKIDQMIFKEFGISEEEIQIISDDLKARGIFDIL